MKQKLLLLIAVFFGVIAFVLTYQQIQREKIKIRGQAITSKLIRLTVNKNLGDKIEEDDIVPYTETRIKSTAVFFPCDPMEKPGTNHRAGSGQLYS